MMPCMLTVLGPTDKITKITKMAAGSGPACGKSRLDTVHCHHVMSSHIRLHQFIQGAK